MKVNHYWSKVVELNYVDDLDNIVNDLLISVIIGAVSVLVWNIKGGYWLGAFFALFPIFCIFRIIYTLILLVKRKFNRQVNDKAISTEIKKVKTAEEIELIKEQREERKKTKIGDMKHFDSRRFYK